ncbi:MAG TPA: ATP-binding cassette domain-containing protein [Polyangiaceae bacterium]|nr:ATP-binding cassette domain-containing protein [Polyangiaceae bacterium]
MGRARSFLAEQVVQASRMDCGPAALKCLLAGFGVRASYDRLREACQTSLDGTSIDTLEEVANALGIPAAQYLVPKDALPGLSASLAPALVVVSLPGGANHFVVLWRRAGGLLHVMDPAVGRRWLTPASFAHEVYVHEIGLVADDWLGFALEGPFGGWLLGRLGRLERRERARGLFDRALKDAGWRGFAALDAAARIVARARRAGAGRAPGALERCFELALGDLGREGADALPAALYSARPAPANDEGDECVLASGAVVLAVHGARPSAPAPAASPPSPRGPGRSPPPGPRASRPDGPAGPPSGPGGRGAAAAEGGAAAVEPAVAGAALRAAVDEAPPRPVRELLSFLGRDGRAAAYAIGFGLVLSASGTVLEALLFRASFVLLSQLGVLPQRLGFVALVVAFLASLLALELVLQLLALRVGVLLDVRLRAATLFKVPRLEDAYLRSRLVSDMAQRVQNLHFVRELPPAALQFGRAAVDLAVTLAAIALLDPGGAPVAFAGAVASLALPLAGNRLLVERDMREQAHAGALSAAYFDALQGLVPIRAHGAQRAVRVEQEALLVGWLRAARSQRQAVTALSGLQAAVGVATLVALVYGHFVREPEAQGLLLVLFWAQRVPGLGQSIAASVRQYPSIRNALLRVTEPLRAAEREGAPGADRPGAAPPAPPARSGGASLALEGVAVVAGGQRVLEGVTCALAPGEHVAVVGRSGAGKTSLVGLLLGWHRPSEGRVVVDGRPLDGPGLEALRRQTAWVEPSVHLWNRSLLENLAFGADDHPLRPLSLVIAEADLTAVLERLPEGLQTELGDGGALVSGGEGQRVRLGRALLRDDTRLVILDEPFRGLDRERRRELLRRVRQAWPGVTLVCVTHDVAETLEFPRAWVVDGGRLVEDGPPAALAAEDSLYRALAAADRRAATASWGARLWRRVRLAAGRATEAPGPEAAP